jgi:hypothetical protein
VGYSVATTVLAPAATADLTDLAAVKDELSLPAADTSNDSWLAGAITRVSARIAGWANRVFLPEYVSDAFDIEQDPYPAQTPGGFAKLQLSRWPVLAIASVTQTLGVGQSRSLTRDVDFRLDAETGQLLRLNAFTAVGSGWEALPVTVAYVAGYGAMAAETHTVPATPYHVTVAQAAAFSCDQAVSYADGAALALVDESPAHGEYSVAAGVYTFNAADTGQALSFSYAVAAVPSDLADACLMLVTSRVRSKGRDPALVQRETPGVGSERWWFGGAPGQTGPFPPDIEAGLERFRTPVVA